MITVGVDLGGTNVLALVVDDDNAVLGSAKMRTPQTGDRAAVIEVMGAAVHEAVGDADAAIGDVAAVGIGTPGVVIDGTVGGATNVPGWQERFSLAEEFANRLGAPVRVANDVTATAVAEHRLGAGQGYDHLMVIAVGTGVGAGIILDGRPWEGAVGGAGEFGHMVVVRDGAVCPCGRRGCIEAYAGRLAMTQKAQRALANGHETILFKAMEDVGKTRPTSKVYKEAIDRGDPLVADLLDDAIEALGVGIASAVNLLDVEAVVLGGGLAERFGQKFLTDVDAATRPHLFLQPPRVQLKAAEVEEGGAIGAALLARDEAA